MALSDSVVWLFCAALGTVLKPCNALPSLCSLCPRFCCHLKEAGMPVSLLSSTCPSFLSILSQCNLNPITSLFQGVQEEPTDAHSSIFQSWENLHPHQLMKSRVLPAGTDTHVRPSLLYLEGRIGCAQTVSQNPHPTVIKGSSEPGYVSRTHFFLSLSF